MNGFTRLCFAAWMAAAGLLAGAMPAAGDTLHKINLEITTQTFNCAQDRQFDPFADDTLYRKHAELKPLLLGAFTWADEVPGHTSSATATYVRNDNALGTVTTIWIDGKATQQVVHNDANMGLFYEKDCDP